MAARERDIAGYTGAQLVGQGGFGAVYRASDVTHGREVAIKVLPGSLGEAERRRFDRERQTMGRLGAHPYIIPVYDSGYTESDEAFIVMELATGGSLRDRLEQGPMPWDEAARIMAFIADAAQAAHDNGVLHRDIKPDNILIDQFGNPKLSDFGIAAVASNATSTTSTTATLAHAAPELLQGQPSTAAIDIYAIGSTLHSLVTGRPPFMRAEDETVTPMITRALTEAPPDIRPYGVPDALARVIERSLAKTPAERHATSTVLAEDLRAALGMPTGQNASPTPTTPYAGDPGATQIATPSGQIPGQQAPPAGQSDFRPAPPAGYGSVPQAPQSGAYQPPAAGYPSGPGTQSQPHGFANPNPNPNPDPGATAFGQPPLGGPNTGTHTPNPVQAPGGGGGYATGPSWQPPTEPEKGSGGRIALIAVGALVLLAGLGGVVFAATRGGDTETGGSSTTTPAESTSSETTTPTTASTTTPTTAATTTSTAALAGAPTVRVDCPTQIALDTKIFCSIFTTNATSGEWHLPAFLVAPEPIEIVPGEYEIFIEPTNPEAIGRTFTITATAVGDDGTTVSAEHSFTVVDVGVEINCPTNISLNSSIVCDIVSTNAVEGEWNIPGFGQANLETVPGSNPILIEPLDPSSVGETYTITATVRNAAGDEVTATSDFTVTPG